MCYGGSLPTCVSYLSSHLSYLMGKYGIGEDAQILKSVAETHKLRYFVRTNEDSIFIFTRDCNDKESPHKQIPIEFFHKYFEFKTE